MLMRINKYLASRGVASRRRIDELVERKKVLINGAVAKLGDKVDDQKDTIQFGKKIFTPSKTPQKYEHWMVYKPVGYVSTTSDPTGKPVVVSLVKSKQRLYPVGRLDVDSEGLMILTNDGKLTNRLTHPSNHIPKTYRVQVSGKITRNGLNQIRRGMKMKRFKVAPADVEVIEKEDNFAILEIVLYQGLNRQVRRMMKALNLHVKKLSRVAVGSLEIGRLKPGQSKLLTKQDIELFFS
jgi:23S rRNA pseudouridine2605 synthase